MGTFLRLRFIPEIYLTLLTLGSVLFFIFFSTSSFQFSRFTLDLFDMFTVGQVVAVVLVGVGYLIWLLCKKDFEKVISSVFYVLFLVLSVGMAIFLLHWVFQVSDIAPIIYSTIRLAEWDKEVFGDYLYFLPADAWLEYVFIGAYRLLNFFIGALLFLSLFLDKILFRKIIFSVLLISILSVPVWYILPATSPAGSFRQDVFHIQPPSEIEQALRRKPLTPFMQGEMQRMKSVWIVPVNGYFNVSTIPSLHAGFGLLVVIFFYRLRKYSLAVTLPWFLLNCIGAVYIEQHFGMDILVGIVLAAGVYFFTGWLFRYCGVK